MTHELIRSYVLNTEHECLNNEEDNHIEKDNNDCEVNRRRIIKFVKSNKVRYTSNESKYDDDCNVSYMSTKSNDTPIRPRLAVSHTICK